MKRCSPVKHRVGSYVRDGVKVDAYWRGKGTRRVLKRRLVKKQISDETGLGAKAFTVNFTYKNAEVQGESVVVFSNNYEDALDEAFEERRFKSVQPIGVELVDPSLKEALQFIGRGLKKGGKYAVKGVTKGAKVGAKFAVYSGMGVKRFSKAVGGASYNALKSKYVQHLVNNSYSSNKGLRFQSRARLKKEYPEVYRLCDFSSPSDFLEYAKPSSSGGFTL